MSILDDTLHSIGYTCNDVHLEVDRQVDLTSYVEDLVSLGIIKRDRIPTVIATLSNVAHQAAIVAQNEGATKIRLAFQTYIEEVNMLQLIPAHEASVEVHEALGRYDVAVLALRKKQVELCRDYGINSDEEWQEGRLSEVDRASYRKLYDEVHNAMAWYGENALVLVEGRR